MSTGRTRKRPCIASVLVTAAVLTLPAGATAVTVTVGPDPLPSSDGGGGCSGVGCAATWSQLTLGGDPVTAPGDGVVTTWRAQAWSFSVCDSFRFRVLRPLPGGAVLGAGTSAPTAAIGAGSVTAIDVEPPLPVQAGDRIGVTAQVSSDCGSGMPFAGPAWDTVAPGSTYEFLGALADGTSQTGSPQDGIELLLNADVLLDPPLVTGVAPGSGSTAGGSTVTIGGDHLTGTSQVLFGGVPAASFAAVSDTQLTAVTPAHAAGTVDVTVAAQGGTSATGPAARYTFDDGGGGGGGPVPAPAIGSLVLSPRKFAAANSGPSFIAAKVGTTVIYRLSTAARTTFTAERAKPGVKKGRKCVRKTRKRKGKRCTRYVRVKGSFAHDGAAGLNELRFMGRLRGKALRPGKYRLVAIAATAAGDRSKPKRVPFRIVR